ncbi:MAG TPA: hypothetical protein VHO90_05050, partial [Bacteroidales bacterium]|nr:hypothetical protein [Bacteroidales bacterium]
MKTSNATFQVNFSWSAATDKDNEPLSYDVYADATPNPQAKIASGLTATTLSYRFNTYGKLY